MLIREDEDVSQALRKQFESEGIQVLTDHVASRVESNDGERMLVCVKPDKSELRVPFDEILVAVGRKPNTDGLGLEDVGVAIGEKGEVVVDEYLRTSVPTIYACGDAIGPYRLTKLGMHP